jgi:putative transposase
VRRWPAPVVDEIEAAAAEKAERYSAWGHRKIWAMLRVDGVLVSQASVKRAMARRGLLLPVRYQAERRALAKARKAVFVSAPERRNRIWQMDFSDFETSAGGNWQICSVVDYVTKCCLTCTATPTQTARDAVEALKLALSEAEALLQLPLEDDCRDPETGELHPLVIVTDNGPAFKSDLFLRFVTAAPMLDHVRTRYRAPQTNGVVERWTGTLKYDHLYRIEIPSGHELALECESYRQLYNQVRPHESLGWQTPEGTYLAIPRTPPRLVPGRFSGIGLVGRLGLEPEADGLTRSNLFGPETVQET